MGSKIQKLQDFYFGVPFKSPHHFGYAVGFIRGCQGTPLFVQMLICQVVNLYELHFCDTQLLQRSPWVLVGFGNDVPDEFDIRKAGYIS